MDFNFCATCAWDSASSVPEMSFPPRSRTEYSNVVVAIANYVLSGPAAEPVEVLDVVALLDAGVVSDLAALDELGEVLVHGVHAVLRARLERAVDLVRLALADEVADRRCGDEALGRDSTALAVRGLRERLADDALQRAGELDPDLLLLVRREDVDDTVDRLRGVLRVQGGEDEVTGLGRGQRDGDRLEVTHFADQDDVGVLAQHVLQCVLERPGVLPHLALVDQARLVAVQELDRVLDGH